MELIFLKIFWRQGIYTWHVILYFIIPSWYAIAGETHRVSQTAMLQYWQEETWNGRHSGPSENPTVNREELKTRSYWNGESLTAEKPRTPAITRWMNYQRLISYLALKSREPVTGRRGEFMAISIIAVKARVRVAIYRL